MLCVFHGKVMKVIAASTLFSPIIQSGGMQLLSHVDAQAALWRGLRGKELRPPANSQQATEDSRPEPWKRAAW